MVFAGTFPDNFSKLRWDPPVRFFDTTRAGYEEDNVRKNFREAESVVRHLKSFCSNFKQMRVGVVALTPHQAQLIWEDKGLPQQVITNLGQR